MTYGDVFLENEIEKSTWNFEVANTEALFDLFRKATAECENCLRRSCRSPPTSRRSRRAMCFNPLQARGVISVAERQAYMGRVRDLAKGSCQAWMDKNGWDGVMMPIFFSASRARRPRGLAAGAPVNPPLSPAGGVYPALLLELPPGRDPRAHAGQGA